MSIKTKIIAIFFVLGIILYFSFFLTIKLVVEPSLKRQKKIYISKLHDRILLFLENKKKSLFLLLEDWALWDDTYNYVKKPTKSFEEMMFSNDVYTNWFPKFTLIVNRKNQKIFSKIYVPEKKKFINYKNLNIDKEIKILSKKIFNSFPKKLNDSSIVNTPYGAILIAGNCITDNYVKHTNGIIFLGIFINNSILKGLREFLQEDVEIITSTNNKKCFNKYLGIINNKTKNFLEQGKGNKYSTTLFLIKDINNNPALIIKVNFDDKIFRILKTPFMISSGFIIILILTFLLFLYIGIGKVVTSRIIRISNSFKKIKKSDDLFNRVKDDNMNDEISGLIKNINNALSALEKEKIEKKNMEEVMIKNEKLVAIGRLTSSIAHEINNPMLALANSFQVIRKIILKEKIENPGLKEVLEISNKEIKRIRTIIEALLYTHKKNLSTFNFLNVKDLLLDSIKILKLSKKMINTMILFSIDDCMIYGSETELKEVFLNFLLNSVEAMKDKGSIKIFNRKIKDFCRINIVDTGPGINPVLEGKLFEPFNTTKYGEGVGLGLYVSYKIIQKHGGKIIYNKSYKRGAHFIIEIPTKKNKRVDENGKNIIGR